MQTQADLGSMRNLNFSINVLIVFILLTITIALRFSEYKFNQLFEVLFQLYWVDKRLFALQTLLHEHDPLVNPVVWPFEDINHLDCCLHKRLLRLQDLGLFVLVCLDEWVASRFLRA
jgi:hypothetical protein